MSVLSLLTRRVWIVALLLPGLIGCSAVRLSYGQGPVLVYWWLDGYVDFTGEQSPRVKAGLEEWFAWHRATQLPDYAELVAAVQKLAADKVTPAQVCGVLADVERRIALGFERAVPPMAEVVRELSADQIRHLEQRYAKADDELAREFLRRSAAEQQEANVKRWQDRFESFYGALDDAQRRILSEGLAASPFDAQRWLDERRQRQRDIVQTLRRLQIERADAMQVQAALRAFAAQAGRSPRAEYRAYRQRLLDANCTLVARLHNTASAAQRQRAIDKLKDWEADFRALARPVPLGPGAPAEREGSRG